MSTAHGLGGWREGGDEFCNMEVTELGCKEMRMGAMGKRELANMWVFRI